MPASVHPPQHTHTHTRYVADCLGGALERSGPFGYELPEGQVMREHQSVAVPIGEVKAGGFRHRALLFKV